VPALALVIQSRGASAQGPDPAADVFFDDQRLHTIRLMINPRDWEELRANFQLNLYYPTHFRWGDHVVRNVGIRSRGTGSRSGTKPGLRVDFNLYNADQRFLGLKSVVLRNNVQDPTHLHERLAMELFARLGLTAPREAHARLYVNDEYVGLYSIVENVDKKFLARHFNQDNGYLYEYDYNADDQPYRFESRGGDPAAYSPKPFKPVTRETDPAPRPLAELVRTIAEASDAEFPRAIAR
jgi:spore coat protein CotH